jgi:hypothetical protein
MPGNLLTIIVNKSPTIGKKLIGKKIRFTTELIKIIIATDIKSVNSFALKIRLSGCKIKSPITSMSITILSKGKLNKTFVVQKNNIITSNDLPVESSTRFIR